VVSCNVKRADCNSQAGDGCEVDLSVDSHNCGRCGHDCCGGACVGGQCQPTTIAAQENLASNLTIAAGTAYWQVRPANNSLVSELRSCTTGNCSATTLTAFGGWMTDYGDIDFAGSNLYWSTQNSVFACAQTGCTSPTTIFDDSTSAVMGLTIDGSHIYWSRAGSSTDIVTCPLGGCSGSPQIVESSQNASFVQANGQNEMYWTNGTQLFFASISGSPQLLATRDSIWHFTFDDTYIFWVNTWDRSVERCFNKKAACTGVTQMAAVDTPDRIVLDTANVYWNSFSGNTDTASIWQCAQAGCGGTPTLVANTIGVTGLAVDDACVYWTTGSEVMRAAKP
jgi:hypothetical protein